MKWHWLFSLLALSAPLGAEELYKCKSANGKTIYSDMPCATEAKGGQKSDEKVVSLGQSPVNGASGDVQDLDHGRTVTGTFYGRTAKGTPVRVQGSVTPLKP